MASITKSEAINKLREYTRDLKPLNKLLGGEYEHTPFQLELALDMALDDMSKTPPLIGDYTYANFPGIYLLLTGATIQLLKSSGLTQIRNRFMFNDGGVMVPVSDKWPEMQSWIASFIQEYESKKTEWKRTTNLETCWST